MQDLQDGLLHAHTLVHAPTKLKKKARVGKIQVGVSIKRGCQCNFVAKQLLLDEFFCTIKFHCMTHINKDGKPYHGIEFEGQHVGLLGCLSTSTKQWIFNTLIYGRSLTQVIAKHKVVIMQYDLNNLSATKDAFIMLANVYNIDNKFAKEF